MLPNQVHEKRKCECECSTPCLPLAGRNKVHKKRELSVNSPCLACAPAAACSTNTRSKRHVRPHCPASTLRQTLFASCCSPGPHPLPLDWRFWRQRFKNSGCQRARAPPGDRDFAPSPTACPRRPGRAWPESSSSNFPARTRPALPGSDGLSDRRPRLQSPWPWPLVCGGGCGPHRHPSSALPLRCRPRPRPAARRPRAPAVTV